MFYFQGGSADHTLASKATTAFTNFKSIVKEDFDTLFHDINTFRQVYNTLYKSGRTVAKEILTTASETVTKFNIMLYNAYSDNEFVERLEEIDHTRGDVIHKAYDLKEVHSYFEKERDYVLRLAGNDTWLLPYNPSTMYVNWVETDTCEEALPKLYSVFNKIHNALENNTLFLTTCQDDIGPCNMSSKVSELLDVMLPVAKELEIITSKIVTCTDIYVNKLDDINVFYQGNGFTSTGVEKYNEALEMEVILSDVNQYLKDLSYISKLFAENSITKLNLSDIMWSDGFQGLAQLLETVRADLTNFVLNPINTKMYDLADEAKNAYVEALDYAANMETYFGGVKNQSATFEQRAKAMKALLRVRSKFHLYAIYCWSEQVATCLLSP